MRKTPWRKIKGKWVNLDELSKTIPMPRAQKCSEFQQTYNYSRTNKMSGYVPSHLLKKHTK